MADKSPKNKKIGAHFSVEHSAIIKLMNLAAMVPENKGEIPILSHLRLRLIRGNRIEIAVTDMDMWLHLQMPVQGTGSADVCIPASTFQKIVSGLTGTIDIQVTDDKSQVNIAAADSLYILPTLSPDEWPENIHVKDMETEEINAFELISALEQVQYAMSSDLTRYYLNGVYLDTEGYEAGWCNFASCDGHRLSTRLVQLSPHLTFKSVIIPEKLVDLLPRAIKQTQSTLMGVNQTCIYFETCIDDELQIEAHIASKLVDGTYPDYKRIIPKPEHSVTLQREVVIAAVRRASTIAQGKDGKPVSLTLKNNQLIIGARSGAGDGLFQALAEERITLAGQETPEPITIGFNSKYLVDALSAIGGENVVMHYGDAVSTSIWLPESEPLEGMKRCHILMPMRV